MSLIDSLIKDGWLKSQEIIKAFLEIKRVDFLPDNMKGLAELNGALPIGSGQTISQPLVVAFMFEKLEPKPGEKVLDIGSGSGWTSALLAQIVNPGEQELKSKDRKSGKVIAIDILPELVEFGKKNVAKYNFVKKGIVDFICADGSKGYEKEAPFDRILASATAEKIPQSWKEQLKIGGRIVAPVGSSIWCLIKKSQSEFEEIEFPGFVFVPLIQK